MKKMYKILLLAMCFLLLSHSNVYASDVQEADRQMGRKIEALGMAYISSTVSSFSIGDTGKVNIRCRLSGITGVNKSSIVAVLQKKKGNQWVELKRWSKSASRRRCSLSKAYKAGKGATCRLIVTYKIHRGSAVETKITYTS